MPDQPSDDAPVERTRDRFNRYASKMTDVLGSFEALLLSVVLVVVWAITGPLFHYSDTWQLFINTTTTVITFWMVFVIQNSANRDAKAIHLKLDELLRVHRGARNELINLEAAPEEVVAETAEELAQLAQDATGNGKAVVTLTEESDGRERKATAVATTRGSKGTPAKETTSGRTTRKTVSRGGGTAGGSSPDRSGGTSRSNGRRRSS